MKDNCQVTVIPTLNYMQRPSVSESLCRNEQNMMQPTQLR